MWFEAPSSAAGRRIDDEGGIAEERVVPVPKLLVCGVKIQDSHFPNFRLDRELESLPLLMTSIILDIVYLARKKIQEKINHDAVP